LSSAAFGVFAEAEITWNLNLNGVPVFFNDMLIDVNGPNKTGEFQLGPGAVSKVFSLQFGAVNTIEVRGDSHSFAMNEVPELATVVLLVSGLGFMAGFLKKRRKTADK
jgi:hypothetical protein